MDKISSLSDMKFIALLLCGFALVIAVVALVLRFLKSRKNGVKTPWFEIAPDSVNVPESEEMGKTRLLLKRQFDYVDNYIDGLTSTFLALEKAIVSDALHVLFKEPLVPKTHMETCLINSNVNEVIQLLKNYINGILVINHIGSNKEKIKKYAKSHVCQVVAIVKKHSCDMFCKLSGVICTDSMKYWKSIGIENPQEWAEHCLVELLIGLSELRYSDFDANNDNEDD